MSDSTTSFVSEMTVRGLALLERGYLEASRFVTGYRGVAAYLCVWTPPEILRAGGYHPVLLRGRKNAVSNGKACYRVRSLADLVDSAHTLEDLKMLALPDTCQNLIRTAKRVAELRDLRVFCIEEPCTQNDEYLRKYVHQLSWLRDYISDGIAPEEFESRLAAAVSLYSGMREKMASLRGTNIPSELFYVLTAASTSAPPELALELIAEAARRFTGKPAPGPKVMLVGSPCWLDEWEVAGMVEQAGASVGADLLCTAGRLTGTACGQPGTGVFYNLALAYFNRLPCLPVEPNARFYEEMGKIIESGNIRGIVYMCPGGCSAYSAEKERLILQAPVPVFVLDQEFLSSPGEAQEAGMKEFVESL